MGMERLFDCLQQDKRDINIEGIIIAMIMYTNSYSHLHLLMYQQPECPLQKPVVGQYTSAAVT